MSFGSWGIQAVSVCIPMVSSPSGFTPPLNSQGSHLLLATVSHLLCGSTDLHHILLILQLTLCVVPARCVFVLCLFPGGNFISFIYIIYQYLLVIIFIFQCHSSYSVTGAWVFCWCGDLWQSFEQCLPCVLSYTVVVGQV